MGLLDALFGAKPLPASTTQKDPAAAPGPRTARVAFAIAHAEALALDKRASLLLATSGTDIREDGRSATWEFGFALPARAATLMASLAPPEDADPDTAPPRLTLRVRPGTAQGPTLPLPFRDSPDACADLARRGADFGAGPAGMTLASRVLPDGPAWVTTTWDGERHVPFAA